MAALGLFIGSFLNVCILRLPAGRSVARPASGCPRCGHQLSWYENIPVVSFLALRARCRQCQSPISWQYPIIESITAALYVALTLRFGFGWLLYSRVIFVSAIIVLLMISIRHTTLPRPITVGGIAAGLAFSVFTEPGLPSAIAGAAAGGGTLWLGAAASSRLLRRNIITLSDVTLLAMIGAFLGWPLMWLTVGVSGIIAVLLAAGARLTRRGTPRVSTCLAAAAIVAAFATGATLSWR